MLASTSNKLKQNIIFFNFFESSIQQTRYTLVTRVRVTAGLDVQYELTKNQFANEPEGLRQFQDHRWKALGKENQDLLGLFLYNLFLTSFFKITFEIMPKQNRPLRFGFAS